MPKKSLQGWLDFLEQHPAKTDIPAHIRCREMLKRLNITQFCPIVTIGGTNGKGTSTHCLAAYAQAKGFRVGRYTSPHLLKFNERIAINSKSVSDAKLIETFATIEAVQQEIILGYVDYAFLAAMLIFKEAQVDFIVLEVGLGGRLDAVNSLDADCAILTTIHFDHMHLLGNTREAIGFEKAGIFRPYQIAVCGDAIPPESIRAYANQIGTQLFERPKHFDFIETNEKTWSCRTVLGDLQDLPLPHFPVQNALTVLMALLLLDHQKILFFEERIFREILMTLHIPGRMQVLQQNPQIIIDVAHNPESVAYLASELDKYPCSGKTIAIFSSLQDKNVAAMIESCQGTFDVWNIIELKHPRRIEKAQLQETISKGSKAETAIFTFTSIDSLMQSILIKLKPEDRIIVFGSFYLVDLFLIWYIRHEKNRE